MILNDREEIIELTRDWKGGRFSDGRPRVEDDKIEITDTGRDLASPVFQRIPFSVSGRAACAA